MGDPTHGPAQTGFSIVAVMSCYMPCVSARTDNKWEEAMYLLYKDFAEAKAAADQVVLMGDINVSSLAEHLMTAGGHLFADIGRPAVHEEQTDNFNGFPARRWTEQLQRGEDFVDFINSHGMRALIPEGGFSETYVPWNSHVMPKVLDYAFLLKPWTASTTCSFAESHIGRPLLHTLPNTSALRYGRQLAGTTKRACSSTFTKDDAKDPDGHGQAGRNLR